MLVVTLMSILEMVKLGVAGCSSRKTPRRSGSTAARRPRRRSRRWPITTRTRASARRSRRTARRSARHRAPSKRPTEAELDAVEEAALLAEALASVQEPEEPVVGYSDESEDVAANDPASEYDDEPRPAPRRSRSESRMARPDVFEDRDEALDDGPDGRLVIVEGSSAEVPREPEGPRWGRRPGGTAEEESAASAADGAGGARMSSRTWRSCARTRPTGVPWTRGLGPRIASRATARTRVMRRRGLRVSLRTGLRRATSADAADAGDEEPGAEGVLEGMSEAAGRERR